MNGLNFQLARVLNHWAGEQGRIVFAFFRIQFCRVVLFEIDTEEPTLVAGVVSDNANQRGVVDKDLPSVTLRQLSDISTVW